MLDIYFAGDARNEEPGRGLESEEEENDKVLLLPPSGTCLVFSI